MLADNLIRCLIKRGFNNTDYKENVQKNEKIDEAMLPFRSVPYELQSRVNDLTGRMIMTNRKYEHYYIYKMKRQNI